MLHVSGVCLQREHQIVVVLVRPFAKWVVTLKHDHRNAVGVGLVVLLANVFGRDHRGRIMRRHGDRVFSGH
ncbi:Uncharacterised protein [Mycobacteroides abscessus subsp. abscessus]|nr:Uncharacterised protein [Mycobacteroides abscessus subsp. abscessus]SIK67982.1 Uncharacterised protein [Mycobacteroides abscessus subsp. abscessus]